eukprot:6211844-Pleurochrysis_carterae.AAC.2
MRIDLDRALGRLRCGSSCVAFRAARGGERHLLSQFLEAQPLAQHHRLLEERVAVRGQQQPRLSFCSHRVRRRSGRRADVSRAVPIVGFTRASTVAVANSARAVPTVAVREVAERAHGVCEACEQQRMQPQIAPPLATRHRRLGLRTLRREDLRRTQGDMQSDTRGAARAQAARLKRETRSRLCCGVRDGGVPSKQRPCFASNRACARATGPGDNASPTLRATRIVSVCAATRSLCSARAASSLASALQKREGNQSAHRLNRTPKEGVLREHQGRVQCDVAPSRARVLSFGRYQSDDDKRMHTDTRAIGCPHSNRMWKDSACRENIHRGAYMKTSISVCRSVKSLDRRVLKGTNEPTNRGDQSKLLTAK